jgi:phage tail sheath gpL-like
MSGTINTGVPTDILSPFYFYTIQSDANTAGPVYNQVIVADITTSATLNVPYIATDNATAATLFGATSNLTLMYARYRTVDPTGVVYLLPTAVGSAGPSLAAALAGLSNLPVATFISPYSDYTSVEAFDTYLTACWGYSQQKFGFHFTAAQDTAANLASLGASLNSKFTSILGGNEAADATPLIAAAFGSACALSVRGDPNLTLTDIPLNFAGPSISNAFNFTDRETVLHNGISTYTLDASGRPVLSRTVTTYLTDSEGLPDNSYQFPERLYGLSYVIQDFKINVASTISRMKVVADGNQTNFGSNTITPQGALALFIARYKVLEDLGYVQNYDTFRVNAQAVLDGTGTKINMILPIDLPNQLDAINIAFTFTAS